MRGLPIATILFIHTGHMRDQAATSAVRLIQRFGAAANLYIHLHALVLDGVYGNPDALDTTDATGGCQRAAQYELRR